jgi:hypothetical protein
VRALPRRPYPLLSRAVRSKIPFSISRSSFAISLHGRLSSLCRRCIIGKPPRRAAMPPLKQLSTTSRGRSAPMPSASTGASPTAGHLRPPPTLLSPPQDPPRRHNVARPPSRLPPPCLRSAVGGAPPPARTTVEELPLCAASSLNPSNRITESPPCSRTASPTVLRRRQAGIHRPVPAKRALEELPASPILGVGLPAHGQPASRLGLAK